MYNLIIQKIKNKRIMTACLVLGLTLLVATISCQPMYKLGSLNRVINRNFDEYIDQNNKYPLVIGVEGIFRYDDGADNTVISKDYDEKKQEFEENLDFLGMVNSQRIVDSDRRYRAKRGFPCDNGSVAFSQDEYANNVNMVLGYMDGIEDHINKLDYSDRLSLKDYYSCMVAPSVMTKEKLYVGQLLQFPDLVSDSGKMLEIMITGVFTEADKEDIYFYRTPYDLNSYLFLSKSDFEEITSLYHFDSVKYSEYCLFDYTKLNSQNVDAVATFINGIKEQKGVEESFSYHLDNYYQSKKSIDVTLWVMELPLLGMIAAFIYMISNQIVGGEISEIAMQKSRGMTRFQVILTYLYQASLLSVVGLILGVPLGIIMCRISGCATDFLTFSVSNLGDYSFTPVSILYGLIACVAGIVFIIIPVIRHSGVSIVQVKSSYEYGKTSIWEKCFLDVLLLLLSLYLLYNFRRNIEGIRIDALSGKVADPLIFLDTCLFLVAAGMVLIRLLRYLIMLIYKAGFERWRHSEYAAFLYIIRNYKKQQLISIFLILTIALGVFYSNTARSINSNKSERLGYSIGTDMRIAEEWPIVTYKDEDKKNNYRFVEPAYGRYRGLKEEGLAESLTRVIVNRSTCAVKGNKSIDNCLLYGINTKEFGETAFLKDGLNNNVHWYNYLNALAENSLGVIISSNLAEELGVAVGDSMTLDRHGEFEQFKTVNKGSAGVTVVAIVDDFPGYERYYYEKKTSDSGESTLELKERYLAVVNFEISVAAYEISPYEIWIKTADDTSYEAIEEYLARNDIEASRIDYLKGSIENMKNILDIQIVNGMFSLGFIVSLIVCAAGFLIFWITSMKQRELLFGVYRAMGLSVSDINRMLVAEHIFSTFFSCISGLLLGVVVTSLFQKVFCAIYLPQKHNMDIYMYYSVADIFKLAVVIVAMIATCAVILKQQTRTLNITAALKLGEE